MVITHTGEFDIAYRFITETNQNIFLTGKAGTGKTTFLKYLREHSLKKCVVAAPTGVAAINAHGVTLHSLFQLPLGIILPDSGKITGAEDSDKNHPLLSRIHYRKEKLDLFRSIELLIIDEASMVASYTVDAIDTILRYIRRSPNQPFGGVQILFIGDLYQLPPVIKKEEWEILQNFYSSIFFFDSIVLRNNTPIIIELKEIFRQTDGEFIEILNGIRNNNLSEENLRKLNTRINPDFSPKEDEGYITLTTHNFQSDEINKRKLDIIPSSVHAFEAEITGDFPENIFPSDKILKLKTGAQVMLLKNDTEGKKYFNGKIGVVTKLDEDYIKVRCKDEFNDIKVKKSEWQNIKYKINPDTKEITEEITGSFTQYPLRLAWAITIHKSQGLTFNKVIIDSERAFATGQVYVALSRCTSLEGLILRTPINRNHLGAHKDFNLWQSENRNEDLSRLFIESRQTYILEELQNIFTWNDWYQELLNLNNLLAENEEKLNIEAKSWISLLITKQKEIHEVAEKFKETISNLAIKNPLIEKNDYLQKRIINGANYFSNEMSKWEESFWNHPLSINSKRISEDIDAELSVIIGLLEEILQRINYCRRGFTFEDYIRRRKSFVRRKTLIKSSYSKNKSIKGRTMEETVEYFREGKSIEEIAEERNLTIGTIESHLVKAIRQNLIRIEEIMPIEEVKVIAEYFPKNPDNIRLAVIKEKVPFNITFGKLRMVLVWIEKESEKN